MSKFMEIIKRDTKSGSPGYRPIFRKWPRVAKRTTGWCMIAELAGTVACLVIFAIAQPDLYRTDMWQIGWDHRLNSNPAMILYAYANHRPLPKIAFVWTRTLTDFNVAISVMSLFFLLSKLTCFIMKLWYPALSVFINFCFVTLYTVSIAGQIGPDYVDKRYPAPAAWYFRYGCDMAKPYGKYKSCKVAQGSLGVTFFIWLVYMINLGVAIWAMWPNKRNDPTEEDEAGSTHSDFKKTHSFEMHGMKSPGRHMPFTPRTQAFHTLGGELPFRAQQNQTVIQTTAV